MADQLSKQALDWKIKIQEWQASGKTLAQWSRENDLIYSKCIYWKMRFLGSKNKNCTPAKGFLELIDESRADAGIVIEIAETRMHLSTNFDQSTFLKCVALLQGGLC